MARFLVCSNYIVAEEKKQLIAASCAMAPAPAPPTSSRSRARNLKEQRGRRAGDAPTWEIALGVQRDAAAAPSWTKTSLEQKHRKLLGALAEWNTALGTGYSPVALGKSRLASRWNIGRMALDRYLTSGKLPSRNTGKSRLKKKKKKKRKYDALTMKTESSSDSAERNRFSTRNVLNTRAFERVADTHRAQLALERAHADVLAAEVAGLERERAEYQRALSKSERKYNALTRGDLGSLSLSRRGREFSRLLRHPAEEQHTVKVNALEKSVVRTERQRLFYEKKLAESEASLARSLACTSKERTRVQQLCAKLRKEAKARMRLEVKLEKSESEVHHRGVEYDGVVDELRELQEKHKVLKKLQLMIEKNKLFGIAFVDLLGTRKDSFKRYPDQINRMLLEMTSTGMSAAHVRDSIQVFVKVIAPERWETGDVRIPSVVHISRLRNVLAPLSQRLAAAAILEAEATGTPTGVHHDGTALNGESYFQANHILQREGEDLVLPAEVIQGENSTIVVEQEDLDTSFNATSMGEDPDLAALQPTQGNLVIVTSDNAPNARGVGMLHCAKLKERRDARNAQPAAVAKVRPPPLSLFPFLSLSPLLRFGHALSTHPHHPPSPPHPSLGPRILSRCSTSTPLCWDAQATKSTLWATLGAVDWSQSSLSSSATTSARWSSILGCAGFTIAGGAAFLSESSRSATLWHCAPKRSRHYCFSRILGCADLSVRIAARVVARCVPVLGSGDHSRRSGRA